MVVPLVIAAQTGQADEAVWTSVAKAEEFLANALPTTTRENPKYLTKADGVVSEWITEKLLFSRDANNSVRVSMFESYTQTRAGVSTPGKHDAQFSLAEVDITSFEEAADVTPTDAPSRGVLFTCKKPGCINARWNGEASRADKTDVSIQDDAALKRILSAFQYLQTHDE